MNKEEILKKSQQENKYKFDEREMSILGIASRMGMLVGGVLCIALVFVSQYLLNSPELALAAWMVYFAMQGTSDIVMYYHLKKRSKLIYGIMGILFAIAFAVAVVIKTVG